MKIFNATVKKEGINKNGKAYTIVQFQDENGRKLDSFDSLLLNVPNGSEVDGTVTEQENGGYTNYTFKMSKEQSKPLQLAPVPTTAAKAPQASTVPQEVWEKKDRAMAWMNCNNAAAQLFSGTGLVKEHIDHLIMLFKQYDRDINGVKTLSENFQQVVSPPVPPAPTEDDGSINVDDIPF